MEMQEVLLRALVNKASVAQEQQEQLTKQTLELEFRLKHEKQPSTAELITDLSKV